MEKFITLFKHNRIVRYSVLSGFILLAYIYWGEVGAVAILFVTAGPFRGRLRYNDVVDDPDIFGLTLTNLFNNFNK